MAKGILEFDTNDSYETKRHLRAVKADDMFLTLFEITRNMNKRVDWFIQSDPNVSLATLKSYIFEMIRVELESNGIDIDDLE